MILNEYHRTIRVVENESIGVRFIHLWAPKRDAAPIWEERVQPSGIITIYLEMEMNASGDSRLANPPKRGPLRSSPPDGSLFG